MERFRVVKKILGDSPIKICLLLKVDNCQKLREREMDESQRSYNRCPKYPDRHPAAPLPPGDLTTRVRSKFMLVTSRGFTICTNYVCT